VFLSDLPGVNPATLNGMILYHRLKTKWSGLGDSTELSRMGLSHPDTPESPESPSFSTPEFPDFISKTLTHNVARIDHPNSEIM
jgi:hypothetical protein